MATPASAPRRGRPRKAPAGLGPELLKLRALRLADPRTDAELSADAGIDRKTLADALSDSKRSGPLHYTVGKILAALGRKWADLD